MSWIRSRFARPSNDKKRKEQVTMYLASARKRMALEAAARAWANGVPWAEALKICRRAIDKADAVAKPLPKRKPIRR